MLEHISVATFKQLAKLTSEKALFMTVLRRGQMMSRNSHSRSVAGSAFQLLSEFGKEQITGTPRNLCSLFIPSGILGWFDTFPKQWVILCTFIFSHCISKPKLILKHGRSEKSQTCENTSLINTIVMSFKYLTIVQVCSCCLLVGNRETKLLFTLQESKTTEL